MKLFYSVCHVLLTVTVLIALINSGLFDTVQTECGLSYYAENLTNWESTVGQIPVLAPQAKASLTSLPKWMQMPANTLVNAGYVLVGSLMLKQWTSDDIISANQKYYAYVFSCLTIIYGPIQCIRIISQSQRSAVLDQWITLAFFSWAVIWYLKAYQDHLIKKKYVYITLYLLSLSSYFLTLYTKVGFEIVLGIHIFVALGAAIHLVINFSSSYTLQSFACLVLSCSGFVFLKVYDMELAASLPVFSLLTGHFWSKVCDCLQIYYASLLLMRAQPLKLKAQ